MDMPSKIGKTPNEKINRMLSGWNGFPHGSRPKRFNMVDGSGALRSFIHPIHGACLSSRVTKITLYSAKKIGICSKIGKQPALLETSKTMCAWAGSIQFDDPGTKKIEMK